MTTMNEKIPPKTWVGWVLTVLISVFSAWFSMDGRVYAIESQLNVLSKRVEIIEKSYDKLIINAELQSTQYNEIKESLVRIEGVLNTKQDKQWK